MTPRVPRPQRVAALPSHPRFISVEGGEGAGKTTVIEALRRALQASGAEVVCTREPGGTPLAERIRTLLLASSTADDAHEAPLPETELLLMFAARAQHVHGLIGPALDRGAWVVSDRFSDSSHAYQGGGRGLDTDFILELERRIVRLQPALTLLLDVGVAQGRARIQVRSQGPDRIEAEQEAFFERVREAFRARAQAEPERFRVIDAAQPVDRVAAEAVACLRAWQQPA